MEHLEPIERPFFEQRQRQPKHQKQGSPRKEYQPHPLLNRRVIHDETWTNASPLSLLRAVVSLVEDTKARGGSLDDAVSRLPDGLIDDLR